MSLLFWEQPRSKVQIDRDVFPSFISTHCLLLNKNTHWTLLSWWETKNNTFSAFSYLRSTSTYFLPRWIKASWSLIWIETKHFEFTLNSKVINSIKQNSNIEILYVDWFLIIGLKTLDFVVPIFIFINKTNIRVTKIYH